MAIFGDFLRPVFAASRDQHISDLHSKFALGPCVEVGLTSNLWPLRLGEEIKKKDRKKLEMWANAQRDDRPAEYRWRRLFNPTVWLTPTTRVQYSNAAKTRNPLKLPGVPQPNETISAASGLKFTILCGHVEEILLFNKFFSDCRYMP